MSRDFEGRTALVTGGSAPFSTACRPGDLFPPCRSIMIAGFVHAL